MEQHVESNGGDNGGGYFTLLADVEVLSKDKGSEGAWFPATILDPPANPSASKRKTFTSTKVLIQYKTLVSDNDPTEPLVEPTTLRLLRPAPLADNAEERFEQNDVVDAFYADGWWPGVVMSVVGDKYTVGFKNPPDVLEVERSGLRSHWDWDHGVWTRAPRKEFGGSNYKPGTAVEVNLERNHLWCSWIPAIFIGQLGSNSFLVQYRYKTPENGNENGLVKVVVADHQIRPCPPQQEENDFALLQMVDAFDDMGWWVGEITNVLAEKKYNVAFKFTKEEKEFCHSELRCHLEWIDKKWTTLSEFHSTMKYGQPRHAHENSSNSGGKTPRRTKFGMKQLSPCKDMIPCGKTTDKLKIPQHPSDDSTCLSPSPCKKSLEEDSEDTSSLPQSYRRKTPAMASKRKGLFDNEETNEQQQVEQVDSRAITVVKTGTQPDLKFVKRGRKGLPQKLHVSNGSKIVRGDREYIEDETIVSEPEKIRGLHAGNTSLLLVKDELSSGIIGKETQAELLIQRSKDPTAGCMNHLLEKPAGPWLNQNLETYHRQKRLKLTGVKQNGTGVVTDEVFETTVEHIGNHAGTVNQQEESPLLPFVKISPLWEHFESMEVFKKFPQKPHFRPLVEKKDVFREGFAIGSMSAFASLVEKISNLRVDDPKELVESYLEGLAELELLGFDVKAIRHRLTEWLDMKVKLGQLENRSREVDFRITGSTHETTTYDEIIGGIEKKIKDLKEKRMMAVSMKKEKVSETRRLQAEAKAINEDIQSTRCDFGKLVAAEW